MPEMCMPMMDGDCNVHCPATCHPDDMICQGGSDGNGEMGYMLSVAKL